MNNEMSRREWLATALKVTAGLIVIPGAFVTTGCGPAIFLRVLPRIAGTAWGAVPTRAAVMSGRSFGAKRVVGAVSSRAVLPIIKASINGDDRYILPQASSSDMERLYDNARLIVVDRDGKGDEFETPYGIYENVGIIQDCYRDEPRYLFEEPSFKSRRIGMLDIEEEVGVLDRARGERTGWYPIQRTNKETGFIHGNCMKELPEAKYYN